MGIRFQCIYITPNGIPLLNEAPAISIGHINDIVINESEVGDETSKCKRKKQNVKKFHTEKLSLEQQAKNMELKLTYYEKKYAIGRNIAPKLCLSQVQRGMLEKEMELKTQSLEENNRLHEIMQSQNLEALLLKEKVKTSKINKQNQQLTATGKSIKLIHNFFSS
jgi:hypothetical protein